jgi:hypothetical protein
VERGNPRFVEILRVLQLDGPPSWTVERVGMSRKSRYPERVTPLRGSGTLNVENLERLFEKSRYLGYLERGKPLRALREI